MIKIAEGFYNLAKKKLGLDNPEVESLALERLKICSDCDRVDRENMKCMACGCYLEAKIRSASSFCPLGKW
jgi:hypothetical protein